MTSTIIGVTVIIVTGISIVAYLIAAVIWTRGMLRLRRDTERFLRQVELTRNPDGTRFDRNSQYRKGAGK